MGRLTLQLFGGVQAHREGGADTALAGRKAQALLAYLALNPKHRCTRDRLATLLWGDRGEEQAHNSLRQIVRALRKSLNDESASILISDGDRLTLNPEAVAVDVQAFEHLSAADSREALEQARALYAGEFLDGIDVKSEGFEEWLAVERLRLHDLAADMMERLSQLYLRSGEWHAALDAARQLLALDPLHEEGHRILMRIYDRTGRRSLALRQYRICEETVRRELDAAPAPETVRLHSEIRARSGAGVPDAEEMKTTAADQLNPRRFEPAAAPGATNPAVVADATTTIASTERAGRGAWLWAVALVVIASAAAGIWWAGFLPTPQTMRPIASTAEAPRLSIVVLPFVNLGNDPGQEYFADAVTEDLTTDLSRLADSFVISRNTAFTYKDKPVNPKQIGRELGVRYVVEGSVRRSGNQVRVNAQLIDAETDTHLWAERFDGDTGDLLALQNEITVRIGVALGVELIGAEAARPTDHPDALDYFLRGRAALNKASTRDNYAEGISLLERALALDPRSVEVQSRLAINLVGRVLDQMADAAAADVARAEELVGQALAASPGSPLAHYAKGQLLRAQGRCEEAIPEYEAALASNRNWVSALSHIGRCKTYAGLIEEAIPIQEQVIRLSPRDPGIGLYYFRLGEAHLLQSRADEAILWLEKARSANPAMPFFHAFLASAYGLTGETERAAAELAEARRLRGEGYYSSIAGLTEFDRAPKIRALVEATYVAGLRKAGLPE